MTAVTAISWAFAALLAMAGARKVLAPASTGAALEGARLPSDARVVRVLGIGEILLGVAVVLVGGVVPAAALAVVYAAFAVFTQRQSSKGAGCGCFGEADAPATGLHVGVNIVGAVMAAGAAWRPGPSLLDYARDEPLLAVVAAALLATAAIVLRLALTALPELATAIRTVAAEDSA